MTSAERTTTMLAIAHDGHTLAVDCGGDLVHRLLAHGLDPVNIDGLFITHEHPDHVAGFPLFLTKLWLMGRTAPINVYGIPEALDQAMRCLAAFRTDSWSLPELVRHDMCLESDSCVRVGGVFDLRLAPGVHGVPVPGVDVRIAGTTSRLTYSCDTEPCDAIRTLADNTDLLVHEANGAGPGHSSARQAAAVATACGAKRLILVHLPETPSDAELDHIRDVFPATDPGQDGMQIAF